MNDVAAPIDAPVVQDVAIPTNVPNTAPNTEGSSIAPQTPTTPAKAEPAKSEPRPSLEQTIKAAAEKSAKLAEEKSKAAPAEKPAAEAKPAVERAPDGKFTNPKVAETLPQGQKVTGVAEPTARADGQPERPAVSRYEAPQRFNEAARKEWETAPESVRAEVSRVLKENEDGITKYKASSEAWEKVRNFDEIAKRNGREGIHQSLAEVVKMEETFQRNPIEGFKAVAQHFNFDVHKVASAILGQEPNQAVAEVHQQLQEARREIAELKMKADAPNIVQEFAQKVGVDNFEREAEKVAKLLDDNVVDTLDKAWSLISIFGHSGSDPQNKASDATSQPLIPAQSADAQTVAPAQIQPNPAGQKSVTGAPGFGTKPTSAKKGSSNSLEDTLRSAFQKAGVRT